MLCSICHYAFHTINFETLGNATETFLNLHCISATFEGFIKGEIIRHTIETLQILTKLGNYFYTSTIKIYIKGICWVWNWPYCFRNRWYQQIRSIQNQKGLILQTPSLGVNYYIQSNRQGSWKVMNSWSKNWD